MLAHLPPNFSATSSLPVDSNLRSDISFKFVPHASHNRLPCNSDTSGRRRGICSSTPLALYMLDKRTKRSKQS
jgi:hypothetical protein